MIHEDRLEQCNAVLRTISQYGRRFFYRDGRYSRFEPGKVGSLWFVDCYCGRRVYMNHRRIHRWFQISVGGTLVDMLKDMSRYIRGKCGADQVAAHLGPFPKWVCKGDPWGYGESMVIVRFTCRKILGVDNGNVGGTDDAVVRNSDGAEG